MLLDDWQKEVLEAKGNIVVRSGRQCGKSTIIAKLAAREAAENAGKTIMVVAAVERQAYLLFEKILSELMLNYGKLIRSGKDRPTKSLVRLKNGSKIYCLPTGLTGYGIRGFTIDMLIADEAAFIPQDVFDSVIPSLAARSKLGARIILLSTPFGRQGYFYQAFSDPTYTAFHVSSEECDRIDKNWLTHQKETLSRRTYAQEFLGEFVDDLLQFFPDELIRKCMVRTRKDPRRHGNVYIGSDVARYGEDLTTFEIVEIFKDRVYQIDSQVAAQWSLTQTARHIVELNLQYNFSKIYIDSGGVGAGVVDFLLDNDQTKRKVVAIDNSKRVLDNRGEKTTHLLKEDLYTNLLRLMEQGKVDLLDDPEIFQSLRSLQFEYVSVEKGKPRLHIYGINDGKYTHIAEGLIRACWAIKENKSVWLTSFKL